MKFFSSTFLLFSTALIFTLNSSPSFSMSNRGQGSCDGKFDRKSKTLSCTCTLPSGEVKRFDVGGVSSSSGKDEKCKYQLSIIGGTSYPPAGGGLKGK